MNIEITIGLTLEDRKLLERLIEAVSGAAFGPRAHTAPEAGKGTAETPTPEVSTSGGGPEGPKNTVPAPEPSVPEPVKALAPAAAPADPDEVLDEIKALVRANIKGEHREAIKDLLKQHSVPRLTDLPPEARPDFLTALKGVVGA